MAKSLVSVYYDDPKELEEMKDVLREDAKALKVVEVPHYHVILELEREYRSGSPFGRQLRNRVRTRLVASRLAKKIVKRKEVPNG